MTEKRRGSDRLITLPAAEASKVRAALIGDPLGPDELQTILDLLTPSDTVADEVAALIGEAAKAKDIDTPVSQDVLANLICQLVSHRAAEDLRINRSMGAPMVGLNALQAWLDPARR